MPYRTELQIGLLIMGMIVWGYGQRSQNKILQYTGLGFFVAAFVLRLLKKKEAENDEAPRE
jgi:hypothetical protein